MQLVSGLINDLARAIDFFWRLKESRAPETLEESLSEIKRSLQRLRETPGNLKKLEAA